MIKTTIALAGAGLAALGWQHHETAPQPAPLKEESMILEYTVSVDEAVVIVSAESESRLNRVEICEPSGPPIIRIAGGGNGRRLAVQGFEVETAEADMSSLLRTYAEGTYELRAMDDEGRPLRGYATLSHELLPAPHVLYPFEDAVDVSTNLTVAWVADPAAEGYRVIMEQGDNDGLTVNLPPGSTSFQVPPGVLAPDTDTIVEVGAIAANGNCTLIEMCFRTR